MGWHKSLYQGRCWFGDGCARGMKEAGVCLWRFLHQALESHNKECISKVLEQDQHQQQEKQPEALAPTSFGAASHAGAARGREDH